MKRVENQSFVYVYVFDMFIDGFLSLLNPSRFEELVTGQVNFG